ncbi:MAG: 50S ribosomal protein L21 [Chloroflexi bacterium]|nr:50S ribosomal protein L21 [Chloroflexota bacterium]
MYAVVSSGGKQYRVEPGTTLILERLTADAGAAITFDRVLLVGDGDAVTVGTPTVSGATVSGTVMGEELGPKIVVFKFKQKVKYRRRTGHRQHLTRVRIDGITANGRTESAPEATAAKPKAKPKGTSTAKRSRTAAAPKTAKTAKTKAAPRGRASASAKTKPKADTGKAAKPATRRRSTAAKKRPPKE